MLREKMEKKKMPGFQFGELMTEFLEDDTPQFDIDSDRIITELVEENGLMLKLIKELGAESELRKRIEMSQK